MSAGFLSGGFGSNTFFLAASSAGLGGRNVGSASIINGSSGFGTSGSNSGSQSSVTLTNRESGEQTQHGLTANRDGSFTGNIDGLSYTFSPELIGLYNLIDLGATFSGNDVTVYGTRSSFGPNSPGGFVQVADANGGIPFISGNQNDIQDSKAVASGFGILAGLLGDIAKLPVFSMKDQAKIKDLAKTLVGIEAAIKTSEIVSLDTVHDTLSSALALAINEFSNAALSSFIGGLASAAGSIATPIGSISAGLIAKLGTEIALTLLDVADVTEAIYQQIGDVLADALIGAVTGIAEFVSGVDSAINDLSTSFTNAVEDIADPSFFNDALNPVPDFTPNNQWENFDFFDQYDFF